MLVAAVALALGATAAGQTIMGEASPGSIGLLAVDMDITGNSIGSASDSDGDGTADTEATHLGSVEDCAQIASGGTIQVDIVVRGYPSTDPLVGYDITLTYDPAVVNVTGTFSDTFTGALGGAIPQVRTLISGDPQSGPIFEVNEKGQSISLPDTDGQFSMAVLDLAKGPDPDENVDGEEVSDGFLARVKLTTVGTGQTTLGLTTNSEFVLDDEGPIGIDALNFGFLSVGKACVPGPQPTPPPAPASGSPTAPGTETPAPGTPGAEPTDGTPSPGDGTADMETPGASTPGPGTPAEGEAPGAEEANGDGLGAGAWAGIGIAIAAAVLAASGTGWFVLRRRKVSSE